MYIPLLTFARKLAAFIIPPALGVYRNVFINNQILKMVTFFPPVSPF